MKKILKITGITLLILIVLLLVAPFIFQSQIKDMVRNFINDNVNAQVEFADVSLSFISSFPQAHVTVAELKITNLEPFKEETLASVKSFSFDMSVKELFKKASEGPVIVNSIAINEALVTLKTNKFGDTNWAIAKPNKNAEDSTSNTEVFALDIKDYAINNSALTYLDEENNTKVYITELNHTGKGVFSETVSELVTKSNANITLSVDDVEYLSNNKIKLEALIDLDLEQNKYTFRENKGFVNNLPLEFNGYVQNVEAGQKMDISFENPGSDFKDFLAVIPRDLL
ncbi:AsmA family protein [Lacinutrix neustonica]|uniref:AsmA family protein n=1 Tax=Lacinutrix neustonica TaxID=2980107 RepID=A0A9E8MZC9_9FLAO|nr:AsmA family protein [Lacinutrix neustonica]WAC03669.1 AsmA family protein [Lacinutrix neustonica]